MRTYKPITDGRTLNKLARLYGFAFDKKFKYVTTEPNLKTQRFMLKMGFELKYFSGYFYPFICEVLTA